MKTERQLSWVMAVDILLLNLSLLIFIALKTSALELIIRQLPFLLLFFLVANMIAFIGAPFTDVYKISDGIKLNLKIKNLFWGALIYFGIISLIYYQFFFSELQIHFLIPSFF